MTIDPVRRVLDALGVAYALIGAHALAARGYPRFTLDIDLLTVDPRTLDRSLWAGLADAGARVDARRGDGDDPLAGVVHILLADGSDIDLVVGKFRWEAEVVARAEPIAVGVTDTPIPVPRIADLILLKLSAGGYLDLHDAAALLEIGDREASVREVDATIGGVYPDVREIWRQLRSSR